MGPASALGAAAAGMVTGPAARSAATLGGCKHFGCGETATRYGCTATPIGTSH